jgi:hypothetical protein
MTAGEIVGVVIGLTTLAGSGVSIGTWVGLRRAESKRIVRAEVAVTSLTGKMENFKTLLYADLKAHVIDAEGKYVRKDVIAAHLERLFEKQREISEDLKDIKQKLEKR